MAYKLYMKDSGTPVGVLTETQLQSLVNLLEEEDTHDNDYYIDKDILDYMEQEGADAELLSLLRPLVGEEGVEVAWKEEA